MRLVPLSLIYDRFEGGELFRGPLLVHDGRGGSVAIALGAPQATNVPTELLAKLVSNAGDIASELLALRRKVREMEDDDG